MKVRAKKHLGQHFLKNDSISKQIAEALTMHNNAKIAIEIGPGMGALTKFLLKKIEDFELHVVELDYESVDYLKKNFIELENRIISHDFLKIPLSQITTEPLTIIGNFPYNISSQILFKAVENKDQVTELVGMFQKEVAERIAEPPGSKRYGILSVLLQAYYDLEYLFTVDAQEFDPPPKVQSGVIRMRRNTREKLPCDDKLFKRVVKTAFNQRRKTMRNSLKALIIEFEVDKDLEVFNKRPEQMSVEQFIELTLLFEGK